jgi:hypothetical protein
VERIDVTAVSGQTFRLKVLGSNADVDLRMTNLVSAETSRVYVYGTEGADTFTFATGSTHTVTVNGVTYSFSTKTARRFDFQGNGGRDSFQVSGSVANETVTMRPTAVQVKSSTYELQGLSMEDVRVHAGDDRFEARPTSAQLTDVDGTYTSVAEGFDFVYATAGTGIDRATLFDSAGNDRFDATSTYAVMQGTTGTYYNYAQGFDSCVGRASSGVDSAFFHDSKGNDRFVATPTEATMTDSNNSYANSATGFDYVYAYSRNGGDDSAVLVDSAGNDVFAGMTRGGLLRGAKNEYSNYAEGFRNLEVRSENGGNDLAYLSDVTLNDKLFGRGKELSVTRGNLKSVLQGFAKVTAAAASRSTATADVQAVDYVFQRIGRWR